MPVLGVAGGTGMIASRRLGRSAFVLGFLCCVLSAANFALWKKYGGMPALGATNGPTPVTRQASQILLHKNVLPKFPDNESCSSNDVQVIVRPVN